MQNFEYLLFRNFLFFKSANKSSSFSSSPSHTYYIFLCRLHPLFSSSFPLFSLYLSHLFLSLYLSLSFLSTSLSIYLSHFFLSLYLSVSFLSISLLFIYLSIYLSPFYLPLYLSVSFFLYISIYLSPFFSVSLFLSLSPSLRTIKS